MKKILQYLFEHKTLDKVQAKEVLMNISKGMYNESEIAAFITVYLMRSITIEELEGFRGALLELCLKVDLNGHSTIGPSILKNVRTTRFFRIGPTVFKAG